MQPADKKQKNADLLYAVYFLSLLCEFDTLLCLRIMDLVEIIHYWLCLVT